jgi:hypothetical protein
MHSAPFDLVRQLPRAPRGTRYIYVDDQVLLVNVNTRLVLDFINISVSKPAPKTVDRMPSYEEQHPSYSHQPPSHARAYEVAQGRPFTEDEHPSSHGQGHKANKGKPSMGDEHPSSQGQNHKMGQGKPDKGGNHPSSQGQGHNMSKGKPKRGEDHPSAHAQSNKGQGHNVDKGKPLWGDESPSAHAQMDKGHQGGGPNQGMDRPSSKGKGHQDEQQGGPPKGHEHPSGKGKPSMENPMAEDSGSHQMAARGKPDKTGSKGKGKQKNISTDFSGQEDSSAPSSSHAENKGKSSKQDRGSARGPSGKENREQFQPKPPPEESIQIAKAERGRVKDKSKRSGKTKKKNRGIHEQQTDIKATVAHQEPAPGLASPEPITTTASYAPSVFDNNQRNIIQGYYKKSGSKKPGKRRQNKGQKRSKTSSVAKNDILTQPTEPLPRNLESQLPPPPPNATRVLYNQQVLLIEKRTHKVLDVIQLNN